MRRCPPAGRRAYDAFRAQEGQGLTDFATWCALAETYGVGGEWPAALARPAQRGGRGRARAARRPGRASTRGCSGGWTSSSRARSDGRAAAGMALGVIHDLAVGVHPEGADAWALPEVLARGCTVGAPPDAFNQVGPGLVPAAVAAGPRSPRPATRRSAT